MFVTFRRGRFWCETGAVRPRSKPGYGMYAATGAFQFSFRPFSLLISGSQVRALVRSLQVSNSPGDTRICPVNSRLFRVRPCLRVSLCKTKGGSGPSVSASKNSVPDSDVRDRFDDWVVGLQFVPDYLHHPVSANRTFPIRGQIGPFCGDFRPLISRIFVSVSAHPFWWRYLGPVSASKNSVPGGRTSGRHLQP